MLLTGVVVCVGRWSRKEKITSRIVVGVVIIALFLSLIGERQPRLAGQFSALILLSATFGYGPSILKQLGYMK
jgi:hypothetical protein